MDDCMVVCACTIDPAHHPSGALLSSRTSCRQDSDVGAAVAHALGTVQLGSERRVALAISPLRAQPSREGYGSPRRAETRRMEAASARRHGLASVAHESASEAAQRRSRVGGCALFTGGVSRH